VFILELDHRIRRRGAVPSGEEEGEEDRGESEDGDAAAALVEAEEGGEREFLYGYVFCRQRQDNSLRRGGEQRAVVVLSRLPYTSVMRPLCQIAGPLFFSYGLEALIQVHCLPSLPLSYVHLTLEKVANFRLLLMRDLNNLNIHCRSTRTFAAGPIRAVECCCNYPWAV
jgi:hypothetical protein